MIWDLPLPTNRGGLKLHISAILIDVSDADANDFVAGWRLYGQGSGEGNDNLQSDDAVNIITASRTIDPFTAEDVSGYTFIRVRLACTCTDANALNVMGIALRCYYDT